jgi:predicted DNA-binding transcriptional regulator AlpA
MKAEPNGGPVLREKEAAAYLGVSQRWMQERRADGNGPPYCRLTARTVRYRRQDLDRFLEERMQRSTAEY